MEAKRENIVNLAFNFVVRPLFRSADGLSFVLFAIFVLMVLLGMLFHYGVVDSVSAPGFFQKAKWSYWYMAWGILVLSTVGPLINATKAAGEIPLGLLIGVAVTHILVFIFMSALILWADKNSITALLASTAGAAMVGVGWIVQHRSSVRSSRRAHTFSVLMQSRLSKEFQEQVKAREKLFPVGCRPDSTHALYMSALAYKNHITKIKEDHEKSRKAQNAKIKELDEEFERTLKQESEKYCSIQGIKYLLNFYEFVCAGILRQELDEEMLRTSLRGIAAALYEDTDVLRAYVKREQPTAYTNLDRVVGARWLDSSPSAAGQWTTPC
ncbi:MAG TPA: DUF4760 domain-containing protein [Luteimonas sp.]|nr:DUF4760 domain-containing protein [Luteimonas sp.]